MPIYSYILINVIAKGVVHVPSESGRKRLNPSVIEGLINLNDFFPVALRPLRGPWPPHSGGF